MGVLLVCGMTRLQDSDVWKKTNVGKNVNENWKGNSTKAHQHEIMAEIFYKHN